MGTHKGSLQYWQKRRARNRLPRLRSAPIYVKQPIITNLVGFKVAMAHLTTIDDSESPSKGIEISRPCTFVEIPETKIYGARFYGKDEISHYRKALTEFYADGKGKHKDINALKSRLNEFSDLTVLLTAAVKGTATGQHRKVRYESNLGGSKIEDKFNFAAANMGKQVSVPEAFKGGEYVDVTSVSTGKGWQGTIKRFGTARLYHKATQKIRHVGTLGPFTPGKVLFTVPQAGQMGFNYRTEYNKRILKIGKKEEAKQFIPKAGFKNYGNINNEFIILDGSIPGPSKRLVRVRKSVTDRNKAGIKEPKLQYISTAG